MAAKLLLVDDDITFIDAVKASLKSDDLKIVVAYTIRQAVEEFKAHGHEFDCIVLDVNLPDGKGHDLATLLKRRNPRLELVFATGDTNADLLTTLLETGCSSFIAKGKGREVIRNTITSAIQRFKKDRMLLKAEDSEILDESEKTLREYKIISKNNSMLSMVNMIGKLREQNVDCLILGETGTGKELIARAIAKDRGNFVAVNAATYAGNDNFAERDFFGSTKSAFTGAIDQKGFFEAAQGGTLFIDEVHAMSSSAQRILLRALQEKSFKRMGDNSGRLQEIKCRIIYGGKAELRELAMSGHFVSDLFFRISRNTIEVTALRDRPEDIEPLVRHFSEVYNKKLKTKKYFRSDALPLLVSMPWPGNVRQLENLVSDLTLSCDDEIITSEHVAKHLKLSSPIATPNVAMDLNLISNSFNANFIINALRQSASISDAAEKLGIPRTTLNDRCKRLKINASAHLSKIKE